MFVKTVSIFALAARDDLSPQTVLATQHYIEIAASHSGCRLANKLLHGTMG